MKKVFWIVGIFCVSGCDLNENTSNVVLTEDLIYVSSEIAQFSGRIIETSGTVFGHGFEVSLTEGFESPIIIDNGAPLELGFFIGAVEGLEANQEYFFRAFMLSSEEIVYGDIDQFQTFSPEAEVGGLSPSIADSGDEITVFAQNVTKDVEVFFGDKKAVINDVKFESVISVRVPSIENAAIVPITIRMQGQDFKVGDFEYVVGQWRREPIEFPEEDVNLFEPAYVQSGEAFLLGLGFNITLINYLKMWQLNFETFEWAEVPISAQMRDPFRAQDCFGSGKISTFFGVTGLSNQFFCFDESTLTAEVNTPFFLYKSIGAKINNDVYVYGGLTDDQRKNNIAYRFFDGEWEELGIHPVVPASPDEDIQLDTVLVPVSSELPNFVIEDRAFFIQRRIVWEFDQNTLQFIKHDEVPLADCLRGITQVMDGKVYLGLCGGSSQAFYEYDPINKIWKDKNRLPTTNNRYNVGSFHYDGRIYVLLNQTRGTRREAAKAMLVYSLSPDEF